MMRLRIMSAIGLLLLVPGPVISAEIKLALGPHYRVGEYLAIQITDTEGEEVTIAGDGVVPTMARAGSSLVPLLVLEAPRGLRVAGVAVELPSPLRELRREERLVGYVGARPGNLRELFAESPIVEVAVDAAWLAGSPIVLDLLDAVVLDRWPAGELDARAGQWLAAGMAIVVVSETKPDEVWPWRRESIGWVLRPGELLGPRDALADESAYLPAAGWRPGTPARVRRLVVLAGVLFTLAALAAALLPPRGWMAAGAVAGVSMVAVVVILLWSRGLSPLRQIGGQVAVIHDDRGMVHWDQWTYFTSAPRVNASMPLGAPTWPLLIGPSQAQRAAVALHWGPEPAQRWFAFEVSDDARVAFVSRFVTAGEGPRVEPWSIDNPLVPLARRLYLREGWEIAGQLPRDASAEAWPAVVITRSR